MFTFLFHKQPAGVQQMITSEWVMVTCIVVCLSGCTNLKEYEVTFNDRAIYYPQKLFSDYRIDDKALANCIEQAIEDFEVYSADGLEILNCSSAGINSLIGLSQFGNLKRLKLSENNIRNLVELTVMTELTDLQVDGNQVVDAIPLASVPKLKRANLAGNATLQCGGLAKLPPQISVTPPEHCIP